MSCRACPINLKPGPAVRRLGLMSSVSAGLSYRAGPVVVPVLLSGPACSEAITSQVAPAYTAAALTSRDVRLAYPGPAHPPSKATEVCAKSRLLRESTLACRFTTPCPCIGPVIPGPMITLTFKQYHYKFQCYIDDIEELKECIYNIKTYKSPQDNPV